MRYCAREIFSRVEHDAFYAEVGSQSQATLKSTLRECSCHQHHLLSFYITMITSKLGWLSEEDNEAYGKMRLSFSESTKLIFFMAVDWPNAAKIHRVCPIHVNKFGPN